MTITWKTDIAVPESERNTADLVDAGLGALRAGAPEAAVAEAFGHDAGRVAATVSRLGLLPVTPQAQPDARFLDELEARVVGAHAAAPGHVRVTRWRFGRRRALVAVAAVSLLAIGVFLSAYPGRGMRPLATAAAQTGTATGATPISRSTSHPVGRATAVPNHRLSHEEVAVVTSNERRHDAAAPVAAPSGASRSATAVPASPSSSRGRFRTESRVRKPASSVRQAASR